MLNTLAFIGPEPMLIIFVLVLVLFGGKKIPELMRGVGQGVGELKKGLEDGQRQVMDSVKVEAKAEEAKPVTPSNPTPTN